MERLIEIAKRLGIKPDSDMAVKTYIEEIKPFIEEKGMGLEPSEFSSLFDIVYESHKRINRNWDEERLKANVDYVRKAKSNNFSVHDQMGNVGENANISFIYHDSRASGSKVIERFTLDLKQDSADFPAVIDRLDKFITEHKTCFKIVTYNSRNRSDTMNLYMREKITPEIAAEVYDIVKPVLVEDNHDYLDGVDMILGGKIVKGIKYGPDPSYVPAQEEARSYVYDTLKKDFGWHTAKLYENKPPQMFVHYGYLNTAKPLSLGEFSSYLEELELIYYLYGKEGECPFTLAHRYGKAPDAATAERWGYIRDSYDTMDITSAYLHLDKSKNVKSQKANIVGNIGKVNNSRPATPMTEEQIAKATALLNSKMKKY